MQTYIGEKSCQMCLSIQKWWICLAQVSENTHLHRAQTRVTCVCNYNLSIYGERTNICTHVLAAWPAITVHTHTHTHTHRRTQSNNVRGAHTCIATDVCTYTVSNSSCMWKNTYSTHTSLIRETKAFTHTRTDGCTYTHTHTHTALIQTSYTLH